MKIRNLFTLVACIVISELAGVIGSLFTTPSIATWYVGLVKPSFNPPAWVFGPVWTTLFLLMGIALYVVYIRPTTVRETIQNFSLAHPLKSFLQKVKVADQRNAIGIFVVQLTLNTLWSILFFGLHSPGAALVEIVFLWLAILGTIIAFYKISKPAAYLLVPYIAWVSFAVYLNLAIFRIN